MEDPSVMAQLHAPLVPLLRLGLSQMSRPTNWVVDVAAGLGEKAPILQSVFGLEVPIVELDIEREKFARATTFGVVGDAHALPFRSNSCDACCCIASVGLFADPVLALTEMERVLRPGGETLVLTSASLWAQVILWPSELAHELTHLYIDELTKGTPALAASPDVGGRLTSQMKRANLPPVVRAFWLDRLPKAETLETPEPADLLYDCVMAELPLLPWAPLRELLAPRLSPRVLHLCDRMAEEPQIEPCLLAVLGMAQKAR